MHTVFYSVILSTLLVGCMKNKPEPVDVPFSSDQILLVWWNGTSERFGTLNTDSMEFATIGTVGDLSWWQQQSITKNDMLYTLGFTTNDLNPQVFLYKNDLQTGSLISKTTMPPDTTNVAIAGTYRDQILLVWWNGTSEEFGTLDTDSAEVSTIGTVGDLGWWQQQSIAKNDALYTLGFTTNDSNPQVFLYKNDLQTGSLVSKTTMPPDTTNVAIAGTYRDQILLVWWNGTSEEFGTLDTDSAEVSTIGTVGDLGWWQQQSIIKNDMLYTLGFTTNDTTSQVFLYKNDLQTGSLISKTTMPSDMTYVAISKNR